MNSNEISIIVQGAITKKETSKCLKSVRRFLPHAEIILSTWEGSDVTLLKGLYDVLVLNKDPGAPLIEVFREKNRYNNMNRQLLSTQAGLKLSTRKYVMKLRSDLILTTDKFLKYFDEFQERTTNYKLFKRKLLAPVLFTRFEIKLKKQYEKTKVPFHISDWWLFGLREDMETYFLDTKLVEEPYFTNYFKQKENKHKISPFGELKFKFAPEQYFGYECFARNYEDIHMEDAADYSEELMDKFRECLVNNFIILEFKQLGIYLNKYSYSKKEKNIGRQYIGLYHFYRYESEYKRICDKNYKITSTNTRIFEDEKYCEDFLRLHKHMSKLTNSSSNIVSKMEEFFIGVPISLISFIFKHWNSR